MRFSALSSVVLLLVACAFTATLAADSAVILASKSVLNNFLVADKDITVLYKLYNVGSGPATNVELVDYFPENSFQIVAGSLKAKWAHIAPGTNVSHVVIVRPLAFGNYNFTFAQLAYLETPAATEQVVGLTSAPGVQEIYPFIAYDRFFGAHIFEWVVFAVALAVLVGGPSALYLNSRVANGALSSTDAKKAK